ncbi:MAG TPA: glycosyltransferase [Pyrinomonadaceae bacterium]|jgi:glycosyltransferase involved in cell wall biosynthesis|nr:glycosyltransferase [Pyrinomonadaceae bacterium]
MRLNWFSPLPPAKTGIADYSFGILPELSSRAEVTLWTDRAGWDPRLEKFATVRHYQPDRIDWVELNRAELSFYNIGNNHLYHASIWQVSRKSPGIVILHDARLHDFFESLYRGQWRDQAGYLAQIEKHYGDEGLRIATEFVSARHGDFDLMAQRFPMTGAVLENAVGAVVHTKDAFDDLKTSHRCPVFYAPLPSAPIIASGPTDGRSANTHRLIIFGHIGRNRRLDAVLEALAQLPQRDLFQLDIYGEIDDPKTLRHRIQMLNLRDTVRVHGYAPAAELDHALSMASLAINLRYPTMGEASASQLRIWEHALPSLVTRVGWYASLPADAVAHVRPDNEVADIRSHLETFLQDPDRFARMGQHGRRLVETEHHPKAYVNTILSLVENAREFKLRRAAFDLAQRAGTIMGSWSKEMTADNDSQRRVAEKIHTLLSA